MTTEEELIKISKPFLRWAGGKRWLLKHIESVNKLKINNYYEPFLGGGSMFFSLNNYKTAYLSDLNYELIETYKCIKSNVDELIFKLKSYENTEIFYYQIRDKQFIDPIERAAKFIYLNKTSYNGIYRVNQKGEFNVPYGFRKKDLDLVDIENLINVNQKLQNVSLDYHDFEGISNLIVEGDFIFLDPPYTVAHENNGFIQYNQKIFSIDDQKRLANFIEKIKSKGAFYILTNAKHKAISEIYKKIDLPITLTRSSTVGGIGARREDFKEYIFSNCLG